VLRPPLCLLKGLPIGALEFARKAFSLCLHILVIGHVGERGVDGLALTESQFTTQRVRNQFIATSGATLAHDGVRFF